MSLTKLNLKFKSLTSRVWRHHEASELLMKKPRKLRAALNKVRNLTRLLSSKKVQHPASFPAESEAVYPTIAAALASIGVCPGSTTLPFSEVPTLFDYHSKANMTPSTSFAASHVSVGELEVAVDFNCLLKKSASSGSTATIHFIKQETITPVFSAIPCLEESDCLFEIGNAADILECDCSFYDSESLDSKECSSLIGVTSINCDTSSTNSLDNFTDFVNFSDYSFDFTMPGVSEPTGVFLTRLSTSLLEYRVVQNCLIYPEERYKAEKADGVEKSSNGFEVVTNTVVVVPRFMCPSFSSSSSFVEFCREVPHDEMAFPHSHQPMGNFLDDSKASSAVNCVLRATVVVGGRCNEASSELEGANNSGISTQSDVFKPQLISDTPLTPNEDLKNVNLSETATDSSSENPWINHSLTQSELNELQNISNRLSYLTNFTQTEDLIRALHRNLLTAKETRSRIRNADTLKFWIEKQVRDIPEFDRSLFLRIQDDCLALEALHGWIPYKLEGIAEFIIDRALSVLDWELSIAIMMNENGYTNETIKQMNSRANGANGNSWADGNQSSGFDNDSSGFKYSPKTLVNKHLQRVIDMDY
ncbi:uncharacterized protein KQ657_001070 [Scheffersomyces spartinae]|uniref:Uncharacterized protein n=1 Tax=Scheffersomyces spartinae TaxID=45513 RepID=A0A9P7V8F2_9ASCO|nr:uncharacterized protein KQ657_001070 [Scheffersomyces spartinae]KAG7192964.1 hypothetical protein KQ657_001070 [Scheffersomyces spartinae]